MPKGKEDSRLVGAGAGGVQPAPPAGGDTLDDLMAIPVGVGPTPTTVREAEEFDIRDAIVRAKVRAFRSHIAPFPYTMLCSATCAVSGLGWQLRRERLKVPPQHCSTRPPCLTRT